MLLFLTVQILATSSPTGQGLQAIFKMGAFCHHFIHHLFCHHDNIGIADFVHLHYSGHEHHESDHAEHKNLPFQHQKDPQNLAPLVLFLLPPLPFSLSYFQHDGFPKRQIAHSQQRLLPAHSSDIWQPPKVGDIALNC